MSARESLTIQNCKKRLTSCRLILNAMNSLFALTPLHIENLKLPTNLFDAIRVTTTAPAGTDVISAGLIALAQKVCCKFVQVHGALSGLMRNIGTSGLRGELQTTAPPGIRCQRLDRLIVCLSILLSTK